jgi:hypothetical protein
MWQILVSSVFWFLFAAVFAMVEIESEGKFGWAERAPTWYRTAGFAGRLYGLLMGGKPLTGYHAAMFFIPVMIFHAGFLMGAPWSPEAELTTWAMYFAWNVLWDFLWFVLNPHYTIAGFRKNLVWWHAKSRWVGGMFPLDYLAGLIVSLACAALAAYVARNVDPLYDHLGRLVIGLAMIVGTVFLAPYYGLLYWEMRTKDDRDKADIFHK